MMKLEDNAIYPPAPVWKGYAVFRVMKKRPADEKEFPRLRESYFKQVESNKKYEQLAPWLKKLKQDAGIVVYPQAVSETGTR
jgi:parvulin-like peptidyl-prolyl isomerase